MVLRNSCLTLYGLIIFLFLIKLTNQDKTPAVISRAMAKHNLEVEPEEGYELVQVISDERGKTCFRFYFDPHKCSLGALNALGVNFLYLYTFPIFQTYSPRGPKLSLGFHVKLLKLWVTVNRVSRNG